MQGFRHFTDYRCFHFARRELTERGVTKSVGICECKPDACALVWGDTELRAGEHCGLLCVHSPSQPILHDDYIVVLFFILSFQAP